MLKFINENAINIIYKMENMRNLPKMVLYETFCKITIIFWI